MKTLLLLFLFSCIMILNGLEIQPENLFQHFVAPEENVQLTFAVNEENIPDVLDYHLYDSFGNQYASGRLKREERSNRFSGNFHFPQDFYRMDKLLCQVINQNRLYPEPQIMQLFIANYTCPLLYFLQKFLRYMMYAGKKQMKFLLQRIPHVFSPGSPVIKPFCFLRLHAVIKINISFAENRRVIFTLPYRFLFPDNLSNIFVSQQAIGLVQLLRLTDMFRPVGTSSSETSRIFFA